MTTTTTAPRTYFADWAEGQYPAMVADFAPSGYSWRNGEGGPCDVPAAEVLFAYYRYENYSGTAFVLFRSNGKLYEVNGGHCSCYGLEGQWQPEETTWAALAMRDYRYSFTYDYGDGNDDDGARTALLALIAAHHTPTEGNEPIAA